MFMFKRLSYGVFSKSNYGEKWKLSGSTRGRVELRPRAGAVPKPFENTPWSFNEIELL
jgi:hypothetical protein